MNPETILPPQAPIEQWAIVHTFGHSQYVGRIEFENSLLRIDIPTPEGFRTKYIGLNAIFDMDIVSEEIARASIPVEIRSRALDIPIVPREQYEEAVRKQNRTIYAQQEHIRELERRLVAVNPLPASLGDPGNALSDRSVYQDDVSMASHEQVNDDDEFAGDDDEIEEVWP